MKTLKRLSRKFLSLTTAATFAERGHYREAERALKDEESQLPPEVEKEHHVRLLVIGKDANFSENIINYAIEMAKRLSYEIVAVSISPLLACNTLSVLHHHKDKVCTEFEEHAKKSIKAFQAKAKEHHIDFTYIIKFDHTHEVLQKLKQELGGFEFIVSEEEGNGEIFVYSLL